MRMSLLRFSKHSFFGTSFGALMLVSASACIADSNDNDAEFADEVVGEAVDSITWSGNGHNYLFISDPADWNTARAVCMENGYRLVSINDANEQNWLMQMENIRGGGYWWMGYSDTLEGRWLWEDLSASTYTNWASAQPDNWRMNEDCGHTGYSAGGKWNDLSCDSLQKYTCESP